MNNQICSVCGVQITDNMNGTLIFCTNCGASLVNQNYNPNQQNYNPNSQVRQAFYSPKPKQPLTGREKFGMAAVIVIPILLILGSIGLIGFFIVTVMNKMPQPRSNPTPYSSPAKSKNSLLSFGDYGLGNGQFQHAAAIAVGKDGSIYVGDGTMRIQKFDASGKFVKVWNVTESVAKANEKNDNGVSQLEIDSNNRLYAVIADTELLRYDGNTGKFIDKIALEGEKWMNQKESARVLDMFMQNDDRLAIYATSFPEGEYLMIVTPEGKAEIKLKNLIKGQSKSPVPVTNVNLIVSVPGDIFIGNNALASEKSYIYHFKGDGTFVDRFTWDGAPMVGGFSNKILEFNSKGEIYAYNNAKSQVNVLNTEGVLQRTIPLSEQYFEKMVVDSSDNIFVLRNDRVEKFSGAAK
jgi:hypothetical protein